MSELHTYWIRRLFHFPTTYRRNSDIRTVIPQNSLKKKKCRTTMINAVDNSKINVESGNLEMYL